MVKSKWFGEDKKKVCLDLQNLANSNRVPLSVYCKIGMPQSVNYISIYEPTVSYDSRLGRVIVSYDTKKKMHGTVLVIGQRDHAYTNI